MVVKLTLRMKTNLILVRFTLIILLVLELLFLIRMMAFIMPQQILCSMCLLEIIFKDR